MTTLEQVSTSAARHYIGSTTRFGRRYRDTVTVAPDRTVAVNGKPASRGEAAAVLTYWRNEARLAADAPPEWRVTLTRGER